MKKAILPIWIMAALLIASSPAEAKIFKKKAKKAQTEKVEKPAPQNGLKPYSQVITDKARSTHGFLTVHKVANNYFIEIPDSMLGRDILIVNRISKAPASRQKSRVGYPGDIIGSKVVRFETGTENNLLYAKYPIANVPQTKKECTSRY